MSRQPEGEPSFEPVTFDDMVALVCDLVTVTWKLRGCACYIINGTFSGIALGWVRGDWDGNASCVR